jgi:hypothetical protein
MGSDRKIGRLRAIFTNQNYLLWKIMIDLWMEWGTVSTHPKWKKHGEHVRYAACSRLIFVGASFNATIEYYLYIYYVRMLINMYIIMYIII